MNIIVVIMKPSLNFRMILYSPHKYSYFISSSVKNSTSSIMHHICLQFSMKVLRDVTKGFCQQETKQKYNYTLNTISLKLGLVKKE